MRQRLFHQLAAPAGIDQVVEADAGNVIFFHQVEDGRHLLIIEPAHRKAQSHLEAHLLAVAHPGHGRGKGPGFPPEPVVGGGSAVQADAHVRQAQVAQLPGPLPVDEGAVGGDHRPHAVGHGKLHQFRQVRPHQRFAPGKQHHRHAEILQVAEQGQAFGVPQFVRRRAAVALA